MYTRLERLRIWCQTVIPLVYDDSLSYYEVLCKVVDYTNKLNSNQIEIVNELTDMNINIVQLKSDVNYLSGELEKVKNGDYVSLYIDSLSEWIDKNLQEMVRKIVKYISFGLSKDGHFVAYVPDTWDFITFDTIVDGTSELYGHLILRW